MNLVSMFQEGSVQPGIDGRTVLYLAIFLVVFLLMVVLGWWASSKGLLKQDDQPLTDTHGHDAHEHDDHEHDNHGHEVKVPAEAAHVEAPATRTAGTLNLGSDDLTVLEGIGPKVAKVLAAAGITTFEALSRAEYARVREVLDAAGYRYMEPASWMEQASLAAKGDAEGLKKLQESLKGGRKVG